MSNTLKTEKSGSVRRTSRFTDYDFYLLKQGNHTRLYEKFGAHPMSLDDETGVYFATWAPNAKSVSVIGDFNDWDPARHQLHGGGHDSGTWEGFIPGLKRGALYKFHVASRLRGFRIDKADPYAFHFEQPGKTGSVLWPLDYDWGDAKWMRDRGQFNRHDRAMATYECHLGSWRRVPEDNNRSLTYRELAEQLPDYLVDMGYTHVEFLPITEHPFYGSWGYQTTGYFAPTSRYGTPQDFMYLIDRLHQRGVGVILDWVPSHFPSDGHGLAYFDGTHLYEHADPRQGFHPEWNSYIFNYGRAEVRSFLLSSATFWLNVYHIDGLRVDAVASMLYLDYARKPGEWVPNRYGGKENLEAVGFLQELNRSAYREQPDIQMIAEESTAWPMVTRPTHLGGLGFGYKWNMGWMHDTLKYLAVDPVYRRYHHDQITFSIMYAFSENFMLPLSHDEVVHGKGSLYGKMPGDEWRKVATLRVLFAYMYAHPGKKLLFMGCEFGQHREWNHDASLDWHLLDDPRHAGLRSLVRDLNRLYRAEPALYRRDHDSGGFEWVDCHDVEQSTISFLRRDDSEAILVVCNFTPVPRSNFRVGVPRAGLWRELLNSDAKDYGGAGFGNFGGVESVPVPMHGQNDSISLTLPPLGVLFLKVSGAVE
jgi:1,4-alpha-glucan branching enzyme